MKYPEAQLFFWSKFLTNLAMGASCEPAKIAVICSTSAPTLLNDLCHCPIKPLVQSHKFPETDQSIAA
jgi:hypothetical protein